VVIKRKLKEFLQEDLNFADVSASVIPEDAETTARIIAKSVGVLSGLEEIKMLFGILHVSATFLKKDGESFKKGDVIVELKGIARSILVGERIALNLLIHMSSITTSTRNYIEMIKNSKKNIKIACTRKTLPGIRIFEKKAVTMAGLGADPHRYSLDDMILLKSNHLKYYKGNVASLLKETIKNASFTKKIEIEIERIEDVLIAARNGADIIMLDNMIPSQVKEAIEILKKNKLRDKVMIEVSGGITKDTILDYANAEPDVISIGELTLFPQNRVDFSLRFDS